VLILEKANASFDSYLEQATEFWAKIDQERPRDAKFIVVDLLHNNASVLLGNLFIARFVAQLHKARLAAVVSDHFLHWPSPVHEVRRLGTAFGVERFYELRPHTTPSANGSIWKRLGERFAWSHRRVARKFGRLSGSALRRAVLDLAICNIPVGDLIYDTYLRKTSRSTIERPDKDLIEEISSAYSRIDQYRKIMNQDGYVACVVSDSSYLDFGGLLRATVMLGKIGVVKVLAGPFSVRKYSTIEECYDFPWPREAEVSFIRKYDGHLKDKAVKFFPPRREQVEKSPYFQVSYGAHVSRPAEVELRAQLGLSSNVPAVAIIVPMFDDAPHSIPELLYDDSGRWLEATLGICATLTHIVWLVRNHPYAVAVGVTAEFERIVHPYATQYPHIKICPSSIAPDALFPILHANVSIASTASLEFASVGIPGVVCGRPFYADHGVVVRPKSTTEYAEHLRSIDRLDRLTPAQILAARELAYMYFHYTMQSSSLIPPVLDLAGRNAEIAEISRYWDQAANILSGYRIGHDSMWCNLQQMAELNSSLLLRFDELESGI